MEFDRIIRGAEVVTDREELVLCDIAVADGRIAALLERGAGDAPDIIDASGLTAFPGVIDAHVHFGLGDSTDWTTESRAAAQGGVTTVLNYVSDAGSYLDAGARDIAQAGAHSVIDFGMHFILMNRTHLSELDHYINELKVTSFKYFMNFRGSEGAYLGIEGNDNGFFYEVCHEVGKRPGVRLAVHTENIEVVWRLAEQLRNAGAEGLEAWNDSRPALVEAHDMYGAFLFGEDTGASVYIPHLSSGLGLRAFREQQARGGSAFLETCPHYLTHTKHSELGTLAKVNPPVRSHEDQVALWAAIADGTIGVVGSDHNSRQRARKEGSIWSASAGFPGVSSLLPVMLSEGHHKRGLSLGRIAEVLSVNPARIFGMYPRKGRIAVGSDADLTLVDLDHHRVFDSTKVESRADYSIYDGWDLRGWPIMTIVRGRTVMEDYKITAEPGWGAFVERAVPNAPTLS